MSTNIIAAVEVSVAYVDTEKQEESWGGQRAILSKQGRWAA